VSPLAGADSNEDDRPASARSREYTEVRLAEFIPKLRIAVRIAQPGREPTTGFFSLAPQAQFHEGPETLLERLNTPDRVLPFQRHADNAVVLISRLELEWVATGPGVNEDWICPPTFAVTREERVRVRFKSGDEIEGLLRMELPELVNRASDFLNGSEDFFALVTTDGVRLVNKHAVLDTRVYESSPLPIGNLDTDLEAL